MASIQAMVRIVDEMKKHLLEREEMLNNMIQTTQDNLRMVAEESVYDQLTRQCMRAETALQEVHQMKLIIEYYMGEKIE